MGRIIFAFLFLYSSLFAAEAEVRQAIILPEGHVHEGDFFAMGSSVEISGTITGDAYILASQIFIDGTIQGDLLALGGSIEVSGNLQNNIRVLAGQAMVNGKIVRNGTVVAGNVQMGIPSDLGGNLVCIAGNADVAGSVGNDLTLIASNGRLAGKIMGNLIAYVGQIRLTSRAFVGKSLDYSSTSTAILDPGAEVIGGVTHHTAFVHDLFRGKALHLFLNLTRFAALLMNFLYTFFIGFLLLRYFRHNLESALGQLSSHPIKSFGVGVLLLIFLPLAALLLLMTILGVPFALTLIALSVIGLTTAKAYSIFWASNKYLTKLGLKENHLWTFVLGLVLYFLLAGIPILGPLLSLVAMIFGFGAGILAQAPKKLFQ